MPIFVFLTHLKWIQLYFGFHKLSNFRMAIIIVNSKWACINTTIRCQAGNIWLESKSLLCYMEILLLCYWSLTIIIRSEIFGCLSHHLYSNRRGHRWICIDGKYWHSSYMHLCQKNHNFVLLRFVTYVEMCRQTFIKALENRCGLQRRIVVHYAFLRVRIWSSFLSGPNIKPMDIWWKFLFNHEIYEHLRNLTMVDSKLTSKMM